MATTATMNSNDPTQRQNPPGSRRQGRENGPGVQRAAGPVARCWPLRCSARRSTAGTTFNSSERPRFSWKGPTSWRPSRSWVASAELSASLPQPASRGRRGANPHDQDVRSGRQGLAAESPGHRPLLPDSGTDLLGRRKARAASPADECSLEMHRYSEAETEAAKLLKADGKDAAGPAVPCPRSSWTDAVRRGSRQGQERPAHPPGVRVGPAKQSRRHPTLGDFGGVLPRQGTTARREEAGAASRRAGEKGRSSDGPNDQGQPCKRGRLPCPLLLSRPESVAGGRRRSSLGLEVRAGQLGVLLAAAEKAKQDGMAKLQIRAPHPSRKPAPITNTFCGSPPTTSVAICVWEISTFGWAIGSRLWRLGGAA